MKPLTIEQLRALEVGDWVWLIETKSGNGTYAHIDEDSDCNMLCVMGETMPFVYRKYGKTWLAYKNKEQAEAKGEIVELPCIREVESVECGMRTIKFQVCFMRKDLPCMNAIDYYTTGIKSEAERRLAELTKE